MKKKSLGLNAFLNGLRSILNIIFPVITFPYISRVLSVKEVGKYNFSTSYISYFVLFAGLGIATYAVREGAKFRNNRKEIDDFASQVFSINIISTVASYVLLAISLVIFRNLDTYRVSILIFSIQILFTTLGTEWIYTIFEEYTYITVRSIVFKILSIIALFIFVRHEGDYLNYVAISVFSGVGSNILNYFHAKQFCQIHLTLRINWKQHLKPILYIFASTVATTIYVSMDTTLLGIIKSDYTVGIYSVSVKMYNIGKELIAAVLTVTIPRFALLWGQKMVREYRDLVFKISDILALLSIPASVGVYMLAPQIVLLLSSSKYINSVTSLRMLCPALVFSIFSWFFTSCILIPAKREKKVLLITIVASVTNIVLNILLIPNFAENATGFTTSVAEFLSMTMGIFYSRDIIKGLYGKKFWLRLGTYCIGALSIVGICIAGELLFKSTIAIIMFDVILSILEYAFILFGLKNENAMQLLDNLLFRIMK